MAKESIYAEFLQSRYLGDSSSSVSATGGVPLTSEGATGQRVPSGRERLPISSLLPRHRDLFKTYESFNPMQSKVFHAVYETDENVVVSAPTASGKTTLLELAILRFFKDDGKNQGKVVYIAPLKALCGEKAVEFSERFRPLGLTCEQFTGDTERHQYAKAKDAHIIITTPEKLDHFSRRGRDSRCLCDSIGLLLCDEIHSLDESRRRGATLEGVISRFQANRAYQQRAGCTSAVSRLRVLGLSATAPNMGDIARWLQALCFEFGEEYRPVPLHIHVEPMPFRHKNYYLFDRDLCKKLFGIIQQFSSGLPALVFCSSRKGCLVAAHAIIEAAQQCMQPLVSDMQQKHILQSASKEIQTGSLRDVICKGVGIHTAGMNPQERDIIKHLFLTGALRAICCTTTLAQGINLPAHLVVVKGTQVYQRGKGYEEHPRSTILQMLGRAGRPQFDEFGVAVVMTLQRTSHIYRNVLDGQKPIESHLLGDLTEHFNSEIFLGTISCFEDMVVWLENTFCSIRMRQCPQLYSLSPRDVSSDAAFHEALRRICSEKLRVLEEAGMVTQDLTTSRICIRPAGTLMSQHNLKLKTMCLITSIKAHSDIEDLLDVICTCDEFKGINIRLGEKKELNERNKSSILRIPIKGRVKEISQKVSVLLQVALSDTETTAMSPLLNQDLDNILATAERIALCMHEYLLIQTAHFNALRASLYLKKSLKKRMWDNSIYVCRQLEGIGHVYATALVKAGLISFPKLKEASSAKIEALVDRNPPFGSNIKQQLCRIPHFQISCNIGQSQLTVYVKLNEEFMLRGGREASYVWILAGMSNNQVLMSRKIKLSKKNRSIQVSVSVPAGYSTGTIFASVVHDTLIGVDEHTNYGSQDVSNPIKSEGTRKRNATAEETKKRARPSMEKEQKKSKKSFSVRTTVPHKQVKNLVRGHVSLPQRKYNPSFALEAFRYGRASPAEHSQQSRYEPHSTRQQRAVDPQHPHPIHSGGKEAQRQQYRQQEQNHQQKQLAQSLKPYEPQKLEQREQAPEQQQQQQSYSLELYTSQQQQPEKAVGQQHHLPTSKSFMSLCDASKQQREEYASARMQPNEEEGGTSAFYDDVWSGFN